MNSFSLVASMMITRAMTTIVLLLVLVSTTVSARGSWLNSHSALNIAFMGGSGNINSNAPRGDKYVSSDSALKATAVTATTGPVLGPSACDADDDADTDADTIFDSGCVACPVVLPPSKNKMKDGNGKWQMYYYGNPGTWANGTRCFLPTGYVGLAESDDGIHWEKIPGKEEYGSILAPTGIEDDFDGLHLGVSDVIRVNIDVDNSDNDNDNDESEELHMYYFGASFEAVSFGEDSPMPPTQGLRMRIGKAVSTDNGRSWERRGQVLDYDPEEGLFASWPRLIVPEEGDDDKPWRMLYHAFNGTRWAVFEATSTDRGKTWARAENAKMVLGPGDSDGWDGSGVGTRAVARTSDGELVMVYEAVGGGGAFSGTHRLGLARWNDNDDDGGDGAWIKDTAITGVPGGPVLEPGVEPLQPWTAQVIGTPYLVANPENDGSMRMYFCSKKDSDMNMSIGLVESKSGNFDPSSWKAISPNHNEDR